MNLVGTVQLKHGTPLSLLGCEAFDELQNRFFKDI